MGKIYSEVSENQENEDFKKMVDNLMGICDAYEGRDDIMFREKEVERISNIMDKSQYRSVLLVGDKGIGKMSIVTSYINKIEKECLSKNVLTLEYDNIVSKATTQSEFARIIDNAFYIAINNETFDIVLNINDFGHHLEHDCYGTGGYSFFNDLTKAIGNGLRVIATATSAEFKNIEDDFPYILDYFTVIKVSELTKEQSKEILGGVKDEFEDIFSLKLPDSAVEIVCNNADKYIKDVPFPEKAIRLLDETCASISNKKSNRVKVCKLVDEQNELKLKLTEAYESGDFSACSELSNSIVSLDAKIDKLNNRRKVVEITETEVLDAVGSIVGMKMSMISKDQTSFLREMPKEIKKKVIGQDETVDKIVKNISRNRLGLRKSSHSAGNFIFIGSTGVGKTYLAKQLAKYLYGSEENMLRFDMSEYQSEIDVSKLLGSAPGYVGYKESGLLVRRLAKYPESVVLFDEIEKAHPKIYDVLLQLLDEGFVTGSDGNKVDATKALIIFTSNIGVKNAKEMSTPLGFSNNFDADKSKKKEEIIRKALNKRFSPEFLNRLDNICYFNNLGRESLKSILYNEVDEMNENIKSICGKTIEISKEAEDWLLDKVVKEDNGARPIIRMLQQDIEEELTDLIINDDEFVKNTNNKLVARIVDDKISLK